MAALDTAQLQAFETADIKALTGAQLAGLNTEQISSLTTTQMAAIDTLDLRSLTNTQMAALTTDQLRQLTNAQLAAKMEVLARTDVVTDTPLAASHRSMAAATKLRDSPRGWLSRRSLRVRV